METDYTVWTDGSVYPNPGIGGWAYIVQDNSTGKHSGLYGGAKQTTNNRMELRAVIEALKEIPDGATVRVVTDSQYVCYCIVRKQWKTHNKNNDMGAELVKAKAGKKVKPTFVRGHSGHPENEMAHEMANIGRIKVGGAVDTPDYV